MDFETLLREADPAREEEVPGCDSPVAQATLSLCVAPAPVRQRRRPRALQATVAAVTALRQVSGPRLVSRPVLVGGALAATAAGVAAALVLSTLASPAAPGRQHPGVLPTARPPVGPSLGARVPSGPSLVAALTYDGLPADPGDAAIVLRRLADRAAAQPAPALGPVYYSKVAVWGRDLGRAHYGLDYRARDTLVIQEEWQGRHADLHITRYPHGKAPPGIIPISRPTTKTGNPPGWRAHNPATFPASPRTLWQRFLSLTPNKNMWGPLSPGLRFMSSAFVVMTSEPLPPAVRATMLRLMAGVVAKPPAQYSYIDMGAVTDRAGKRGIAIAQVGPDFVGERGYGRPGSPSLLIVYIYDPATGALLGSEDADCKGPVTAQNANASCAPDAYFQYLQVKAVGSVPPAPSRSR
jgi:hypothetical protein